MRKGGVCSLLFLQALQRRWEELGSSCLEGGYLLDSQPQSAGGINRGRRGVGLLDRPSAGLSPAQQLLGELGGETIRPYHPRACEGLAWPLDTQFPCQAFGEPWPGMARLPLEVEGSANSPSSAWRRTSGGGECYHCFLSLYLVFSR